MRVEEIEAGFKENPRLIYMALIGLVFLSYSNALFTPFIWDDKWHVLTNPGLKGGITSIINAFTPSNWTLRGESYEGAKSFFRPIHTVHSIIDYEIWGPSPFGFHLSNILVHLLNTLGIYILFVTFFGGARLAPFLGAALFAVHPVHTESVTFISARVDLSCCLFYLLALLLFIKFTLRQSGIEEKKDTGNSFFKKYTLLALSLFSFALAILSKEMAVTFPLLLLLYNFLLKKTKYIYILPFFILLVLYIPFRIFGLGIFLGQHKLQNDIITLLISAGVAVSKYIQLLFIPYPLKAYYTLTWYTLFSIEALFAIALFFTLVALFVWLWKKNEKQLLFLALWPLLTIIPVLNIGSLGETLLAERYLYIPSVGFCMLAGCVGARFLKNKGLKRQAFITTISLLSLFSVLTIFRNHTWSDDVIFFKNMAEGAPGSPLPHANLGFAYQRRGLTDRAVTEIEKAIDLAGNNFKLYNYIGALYIHQKSLNKAITALQRAISLKPDSAKAHNNLGIAFGEAGNLEKAAIAFKEALALDPAFKQPAKNLLRIEKLKKGL